MTNIRIILLTVLSTIILLIFALRFNLLNSVISSKYISSNVSTSVVKNIIPTGEFVSLIYHYTTVADFQDESYRQILGKTVTLPMTTKKRKLLYSFDGTIKLGIDAQDIKVVQKGNTIVLEMPAIEVLSHIIDENSLKVHIDDTKGLFAKEMSFDEKFKLIENKRLEIEEKVFEDQIIKEAKDSTQQQFIIFLSQLPSIKNYSLEFVWQSPKQELEISEADTAE